MGGRWGRALVFAVGVAAAGCGGSEPATQRRGAAAAANVTLDARLLLVAVEVRPAFNFSGEVFWAKPYPNK